MGNPFITGLETCASSNPGQEDLPPGQVIFHSHLPAGPGIRQINCQLNH